MVGKAVSTGAKMVGSGVSKTTNVTATATAPGAIAAEKVVIRRDGAEVVGSGVATPANAAVGTAAKVVGGGVAIPGNTTATAENVVTRDPVEIPQVKPGSICVSTLSR